MKIFSWEMIVLQRNPVSLELFNNVSILYNDIKKPILLALNKFT